MITSINPFYPSTSSRLPGYGSAYAETSAKATPDKSCAMTNINPFYPSTSSRLPGYGSAYAETSAKATPGKHPTSPFGLRRTGD